MQNFESLLNLYSQNNRLAIRLISPTFGHIPPEIINNYGLTHRKLHYFFLFMMEGHSCQGVDLNQYEIKENQLLMILPHQIHQLAASKKGTDYFKLGFDENCLSQLPKQYPFLINPYNNQKIQFTPTAAARLRSIFEMLMELLSTMDTEPELILAHLNSLLTEINAAYFTADRNLPDHKLSKYISFKRYIENNLTDQPTVAAIAEHLALNSNSLYTIVKHYSGMSPKEFLTNRLMLEAKRQLYYSESASIKELAYTLGYNDPEYFSRLFKKTTGKTISSFVQDLSGS